MEPNQQTIQYSIDLKKKGCVSLCKKPPMFDCIVEVFRSPDQRSGHSGSKDKTYKQDFGFDRYHETIDGTGKAATSPFQTIGFTKKKIGTSVSYTYHVPWLCLWPEPAAVTTISEIDKSYVPASEAELFCRIDRGAGQGTESGDLVFVSSSTALKIQGKPQFRLSGKSIKDEFSIKISCTGILRGTVNFHGEKIETIEIRENQPGGKIVGQINVIANELIRLAKIEFIPIERAKKEARNQRQKKRRQNRTAEFKGLVEEVLSYLNNKAFNQFLLYFTARLSPLVSFPKNLIKTDTPGEYSASVTKAYFQGVPSNVAKDHKKKLAAVEKQLDKSIRAYYNTIKNRYDKFHKKEAYYCHKIMEPLLLKSPDKNFKTKYDEYQFRQSEFINLLTNEKLVDRHFRQKDTLYVFIDKDLSHLSYNSIEYGAYAFLGNEDAYVFNRAIKDRNYGVVSHEIAHLFGLQHIFELGSSEINKNIEAKIEEIEKKLEDKKKAEQKSGEKVTDEAIKSAHLKFDNYIDEIAKHTQSEDMKNAYITRRYKGKPQEYYKAIEQMFTFFVYAAQKELTFLKKSGGTGPESSNSETQSSLKAKLKILKNEKKANLGKVIELVQSASMENFMDYDTIVEKRKVGFDEKIEIKKNAQFAYRCFCKWQWDKIMQSDKLDNRKLK